MPWSRTVGRSPTTRSCSRGEPGTSSSTSAPGGSWRRSKAEQKIAVEVKSFTGASPIEDLEKALGQFVLYHDVLIRRAGSPALPGRPARDPGNLFEEPIGRLLIENERLRLIVFDPTREVILRWIP